VNELQCHKFVGSILFVEEPYIWITEFVFVSRSLTRTSAHLQYVHMYICTFVSMSTYVYTYKQEMSKDTTIKRVYKKFCKKKGERDARQLGPVPRHPAEHQRNSTPIVSPTVLFQTV
jgi:hypothetical protein